MRTIMQLLLTAYVDYAVDVLSLSAAAGRIWAVNYVWANQEIRCKFRKIELELYAAGLS